MARPILSTADYQQALLNLAPSGRAWNKDLSSNMAQVLGSLAPTFKRLNDRSINLVTDAFVGSTNELLYEWEETLGLPDPCQGPTPTVEARRQQCVARFVGLGGLSITAIKAFALNLGYQIEIQEYSPFFADRGMAETQLWDESAAYLWTVIAPQQKITYFRADVSTAGEALESFQSTVLQCELQRIAPAHTAVSFSFTLPPNSFRTAVPAGFPAFKTLAHFIDANYALVAFPAFALKPTTMANPVSLRSLSTVRFLSNIAFAGVNLIVSSSPFGAFRSAALFNSQTPAAFRQTWLQPFNSASFWNLPIGSGAVWSGPVDPDTIALRSQPASINAGTNGSAIYVGQESDPLVLFVSTASNQRDVGLQAYVHVPIGATPSSDGTMTLFDITQPTEVFTFTNVQIQNQGGGVIPAITSSCSATALNGEANITTGDGVDTNTLNWGYGGAAGAIRQWEWAAGSINHSLRFSLPSSMVTSPSLLPFTATHVQGATSTTGAVRYGCTVGIAASVNLATLGLSAGGLVIAQALQNHGAVMRVTQSANKGFTLYAEQILENDPLIQEARNDLATIIPQYLSVLRNQTATTINGGGAPIVQVPVPLNPNVASTGTPQAPSTPSGLVGV